MANCAHSDGWLCYGGIEIANTHRTLSYVNNLFSPAGFSVDVKLDGDGQPCCACAESDETYTTPEADLACWWDPNNPVSGDFLGFMVTEVVGWRSNPTTRTTSDGVSGTTIARRPDRGRRVEVTGIAFALSCEAMETGLGWLNASLERECGTDGLQVLSCCPADPNNATTDPNVRSIPCVALTEGIDAEPLNPDVLVGCLVMEVTFTLTAEGSWIYGPPQVLVDEPIVFDTPCGDTSLGYVCVDYTPSCIDGTAFEVFVDRAKACRQSCQMTVLAAPTKYMSVDPLTYANSCTGADFCAGPGDSILFDSRCRRIDVVGPSGTRLRPADSITLAPNSKGLYPIATYGQSYRVCVFLESAGELEPPNVRIVAYDRRRV